MAWEMRGPQAILVAAVVTTAALGFAQPPVLAFSTTASLLPRPDFTHHELSSGAAFSRTVPSLAGCGASHRADPLSVRTHFSSRDVGATDTSDQKGASSPDGDNARGVRKLYVGNVSSETTKESLADYFRRFGAVIDCALPLDRNADPPSFRHRGFAFVTMRDEDGAARAVRAAATEDGDERAVLDGRELVVSGAFPRNRRRVPVARFDDGGGPPNDSSGGARARTPYTIDDSVCPPTDEDALRKIVDKHCETLDRYLTSRPVAAHTRQAFEEVKEYVNNFFPDGIPDESSGLGIILDSGCGTARSSSLLGEMFPGDLVVGIDRSLARLSRNVVYREGICLASDWKESDETVDVDDTILTRPVPGRPNVLLVRAELANFWRLCVDEGWQLRRHYLLYPNPYPKRARIKSRFYAHPSFPLILKLGGDIIVRSNWEGYLNEFATSVLLADRFLSSGGANPEENYARKYSIAARWGPVELPRGNDAIPMTNFEQKYFAYGEPVYELSLSQEANEVAE